MKTAKTIWMDGRFVNWRDAKVHVLTHTLNYGGGIFDSARLYKAKGGSAIFRLDEHISRFFYSAKALHMKLPYTQAALKEAALKLIKKNGLKAAYIRFTGYHGYGSMGLNPSAAPVKVSIAAWPFGSYLGHDIVKVKTSKFIRIHPESTVADAKIIGHYSNSILASLEVRASGFDEALFLDYKGDVAEGPGENIFIAKNGILYTPSLGSILGGLTRDSVIQIARDNGLTVKETRLKPADLYKADEAFLTGTAAEITPIASIDKKKIGSGKLGPVTDSLKKAFTDAISGKDERYRKWLTYVS